MHNAKCTCTMHDASTRIIPPSDTGQHLQTSNLPVRWSSSTATAASAGSGRVIATPRWLWAALTKLLGGGFLEPSTYARATWLFLRLLGIVYLMAFWSLGVQILGLSGHEGVLPADRYMAGAHSLSGLTRFWLLPTLAWASTSDAALQGLCAAGGALAVLLVAGIV